MKQKDLQKNKATFLCWCLLLFFALLHSSAVMATAEYDALDRLIEKSKAITDKKLARIGDIRQRLSTPHLTDRQRYEICMQLYEEYESFRFDSALAYADRTILYAKRMNDAKWLAEAQLKKVHVHTLAALFDKSRDLLNSINVSVLDDRLLQEFYDEWYLLMSLMSEYTAGTQLHASYEARAEHFRRLILSSPYKDTYAYVRAEAAELSKRGHTQKAIDILKNYLKRWKKDDHEYAMICFDLSELYSKLGNTRQQHAYLVQSAMSDICSSSKENNSMRLLAAVLFEQGDIERAYNCLNISIEDANFYGTRLRNVQNAYILPRIFSAYSVQQRAQRMHIFGLLLAVSVVAIALVVAVFFIWRYLRRYRKTHAQMVLMNKQLNKAVEDLSKVNAQLCEANNIKEEYIARFLELASNLIDQAEAKRKIYNRLAREKRMEELYTELKNNSFTQIATHEYYINFDTAFLNIFPNFVAEVNLLLRKDAQIVPKGDERLTTELRILALIRLGISDNFRISSILRASLTTVYTYRSKLKARAFDHDSFESAVKRIG